MKNNNGHILSLVLLAALSSSTAEAQNVVSAGGKGSYAAYTPLSEAQGTLTQEVNEWGVRAGDETQVMRTCRLYVNEEDGKPIPTNDWWTDMLFENFGGNLWPYPQKLAADKNGKGINFYWPSYWISDGTEIQSRTTMTVGGELFNPSEAIVENWHDWDMSFSMTDGDRKMLTTLAHGMPYTWIETQGLNPTIALTANGRVLDKDGNTFVSGSATNQIIVAIDWTADSETGTDLYAVFMPSSTEVTVADNVATLQFAEGDGYLSVALLHSVSDLATLAATAYSVPRDTKVTWSYDESSAMVTSTWTITADDLRTGSTGATVMQGFIPHQYRGGANNSASFNSLEYTTPHGVLRLATGNEFAISYAFNGMLPYYALPTDTDVDNANGTYFDKDIMLSLLSDYAASGSFGGDTYWGGKGLTQMGLYMMMAREMGETELFEKCRDKLKAAYENWLVYTPGESNFFFSRDDRYGGMIGSDTSYGSDTYNDHHFHYGYFTYGAALLALVDDDFKENYGPMIKLIAKDYANWDRTDTRFPLFRTFDPWAGHSFAGGKGDGNGNGQESSSEAMQSWGGLYLLGQALGDKDMRDAGIFGWVTEARAVAEYWFDRYREDTSVAFSRDDTSNFNIDYTTFSHPYNSNLTCHGVGWWNYFSGDQLWNAAIQWMPISPILDYLSEDVEFARWDYNTAWDLKSTGGWYDSTTDGSLGDASGLGNVALSYLQRFDPAQAGQIFDTLWAGQYSTATATDTGGITYFITHSHLSHGELTWDVQPSDPMARAYRKDDDSYVFMAYNTDDTEKTVTFRQNGTVIGTLTALPRQLTISGIESQAVNDNITAVDNSEADVRESLVMPNLALNKSVTESGHENVGTLPEYATDGDETTRWGSLHQDGEWLQVDLGQVAKLYKVSILWEAAYASDYTIMTSVDGTEWNEVSASGAANSWVSTLMGDIRARYIKVVGVTRATAYGISLYELQAYGQWDDAASDDLLGVKITTDSDYLKQYEEAQITVQAYTVGGEWSDVDATWSTDDGTITTAGLFTPTSVGTATVTATIGTLEASQSFPVEEALAIDQITLSPASAEVIVGEEQAYEVTALDQFSCETTVTDATYEVLEVTDGDDGTTYAATETATITSEGVLVATLPGDYAVVASVERKGSDELITDTALVSAKYITDINLARDKSSYATSQEGGNSSSLAFDGDGSTRWGSGFDNMTADERNNQAITVDLGATYMINRVNIIWETAYASEYKLQVSTDGTTFTDVYSGGVSAAGSDEHTFTEVAARYVRMQGVKRQSDDWAYGYSIYEMEVYGTEKVADTATRIDATAAISDDGDTYNLQGMKVKPTQRGIYIKNGRKVIVR